MNRIKQLIKELCPNGVGKVMLLDALSQPVTDGPHETPKLQDFGVPFLSVESVTGREIDITKKRGYISNEYNIQISKKYFPKTGDVYIVKSASIGKVAIVGTETNFNIWSPLAAMRPDPLKLNSRFLFYLLQTEEIQKEVRIKSGTGSQPNLSMRTLEKFEIPLPPLPIQTEIVRILDKFVEQQEQLERLIELRKKQYEYYREELLKPKEGEVWETKRLGECCRILKGNYITQKNSCPGPYPVVLGGQEPAYYIDKFNHRGEVIAVSRSGVSAGFISYWNQDIFVSDGFMLEPLYCSFRYLFLYLKNKQETINSLKRGAGIPHITTEHLKELTIPIVSANIEKEIVKKLDSFETTITTLTTALELSKKRYEYYRDKMMRF